MAYAISTVKHRIDPLIVRNAKNASTLHAQNLVTTNSLRIEAGDGAWHCSNLGERRIYIRKVIMNL